MSRAVLPTQDTHPHVYERLLVSLVCLFFAIMDTVPDSCRLPRGWSRFSALSLCSEGVVIETTISTHPWPPAVVLHTADLGSLLQHSRSQPGGTLGQKDGLPVSSCKAFELFVARIANPRAGGASTPEHHMQQRRECPP